MSNHKQQVRPTFGKPDERVGLHRPSNDRGPNVRLTSGLGQSRTAHSKPIRDLQFDLSAIQLYRSLENRSHLMH